MQTGNVTTRPPLLEPRSRFRINLQDRQLVLFIKYESAAPRKPPLVLKVLGHFSEFIWPYLVALCQGLTAYFA